MFDQKRVGYNPLRVALKLACVVSCLAILLSTGFSIYRDWLRVEGPVIRSSANISLILAEHVSNVFRSAEVWFDRAEELRAAGDLKNPARLASFLEKHPSKVRGLDFIFILDERSRLIASSDPRIPLNQRFELPDIWKALGHQRSPAMTVGNLDHSLGRDRVIVPIIKPLLGKDGKVEGLMGAAIDVAYFRKFFEDLQGWGPNGFSIIAQSGPIILRYPYLEDIMGQNYRGKSRLWEATEQEGVGWFYEASPYDGFVKLLFFRAIKNYPVLVLINRTKSDIYESWRTTTYLRTGIAGAAMAGIIWFTFFLLQQILRLERDEHSRRLYERHSQQAQKMESIGRFAGGIAHDFNNILTILFGHLDRLEKTLPTDHATTTVRNQFLQAALRGRDLVRQILAFSRTPDRQLSDIELSTFSDDLSLLLRAALPINVVLNLRAERGLYIRADGEQLSQVFMSLASNGIEAMKSTGGTLDLTVDRLKPDTPGGPGWARLTVRDTGPGISPKDLKRLFEPFFTTKGEENLGLGLPTTKKIVEAAGGQIRVNSHLGVGTRVEVRWPLSSPTVVAPRVVNARGRVLFVDDEEAVVDLVRENFASRGIEAHCAPDPLKAFDEFSRAPDLYSLLITDINMEPMDGFELVRQVHALRPELPVIFTTAHPEYQAKVLQHASVLSGVGVLLRKPYQFSELLEVMKSWLVMPEEKDLGKKG